MKITLLYHAQVRTAAGTDSESLEIGEGGSLAKAIDAAAKKHGSEFQALVLDESGAIRPSLLVLLNGIPADRTASPEVKEGDEVSLLSAVAGG